MAELRNLVVSGNTNISGTLNVGGATTLSSTLNVGNRIIVTNPRVSTSSGIPQPQDALTTGIYNDTFAIRGAANDAGWIRFFESNNDGSLEIATGDDGTEPIYVRQYNTTGGIVKSATILDGSGNTSFPGDLTVSGTTNLSSVNLTGQISKDATSISWYQGRDYAPFKTTTSTGYFPLCSIKTTNGSFEIGHYNADGWHNSISFAYVDDSNYNISQNSATTFYLRNDGYFSGSCSYATSAGNTTGHAGHLLINGTTWDSNWYWSGQGGQPSWLWGSNDGVNMYVWNPSNFSVNYASSAGTATTAYNIPTSSGSGNIWIS